MISTDSVTRKSCGERFDLIASDFVVLAETLFRMSHLPRTSIVTTPLFLGFFYCSSAALKVASERFSAARSIK